MSAIYSTYRDVSCVVTPGAASLVLLFAPLKAVFGVTAASLLGCVLIAGKLHPRLGAKRRKDAAPQALVESSSSAQG
jgi:hypothetical protein